jgi:hypothetical protein
MLSSSSFDTVVMLPFIFWWAVQVVHSSSKTLQLLIDLLKIPQGSEWGGVIGAVTTRLNFKAGMDRITITVLFPSGVFCWLLF